MELELKKKYYERLTLPYVDKENNQRLFIDQYLQGSGSELESKFWSENSSSRLAFDLYSWIVNEPSVNIFQFEMKLPGVICSKRGPAGVPNMDVYIETTDDRIFIESKYTESATLAYTKGEKPNLSKAYWDEHEYGGLQIYERFYGQNNIADEFSKFCKSIQEYIDKKKNKWKWFDVKQETCHLFGIIFYLLGGTKSDSNGFWCDPNLRHLDKKVHLYNIIWGLEGDNFEIDEDSLPVYFENRAKYLMNCVVPSVVFDYKILTVNDLLENSNFYGLDFTKAKPYGLDCSLADQMNKQYKRNIRRGGK